MRLGDEESELWSSARTQAGLLEGGVDEFPLAVTVPTAFVACCTCTERMRFS